MTKVTIDPGVCGFITTVQATVEEEEMTVQLKVASGCEAVRNMMQALGTEFDSFALCLAKPGTNALYAYAAQHFPGHAACPVLAGIVKAAEVESGLALPKNASITVERL